MRNLVGVLYVGVLIFAASLAGAQPPAPVPGGGWQPAPVPVPTPVPVIGPRSGKVLVPPPVNKATEAYAFRTRLSAAALCQGFAAESDAVFLDERIDIATKAAKLEKIESEAKMYNCLTPE